MNKNFQKKYTELFLIPKYVWEAVKSSLDTVQTVKINKLNEIGDQNFTENQDVVTQEDVEKAIRTKNEEKDEKKDEKELENKNVDVQIEKNIQQEEAGSSNSSKPIAKLQPVETSNERTDEKMQVGDIALRRGTKRNNNFDREETKKRNISPSPVDKELPDLPSSPKSDTPPKSPNSPVTADAGVDPPSPTKSIASSIASSTKTVINNEEFFSDQELSDDSAGSQKDFVAWLDEKKEMKRKLEECEKDLNNCREKENDMETSSSIGEKNQLRRSTRTPKPVKRYSEWITGSKIKRKDKKKELKKQIVYECMYCLEKFSTRANLNLHLAKTHNRRPLKKKARKGFFQV